MQTNKVLKNYSIVNSKLVRLDSIDITEYLDTEQIDSNNIIVEENATIGNLTAMTINADKIYCSSLENNGNMITEGKIICGILNAGSIDVIGSIISTGNLFVNDIQSKSLNTGSGNITTIGNLYGRNGIFTGNCNCNEIICYSLDSGSGNITTTGSISSDNIIFNNSLTSDTLTSNSIDTGNIICSSLNTGSGTIQTTGTVSGNNLTVNSITVGDLTGISLNTGIGTIQTTGIIYCNVSNFSDNLTSGNLIGISLNSGAGNIETTGVVSGNNLILNNTLSSGNIIATSLDTGSGTIQTTGLIKGGNETNSNSLVCENLSCNFLNIGNNFSISGDVTSNNLTVSNNSVSLSNIDCNSLNSGSGIIQTTGNIIGGNINGITNIYCPSLCIKKINPVYITQNTGTIILTSDISSGLIIRNTLVPSGVINDTLPSALSLISDLSLSVGDSFYFQIDCINISSSFAYGLITGTGGTARTVVLAGFNNTNRLNTFFIIITSSTTYDIYRLEVKTTN